jgi:hypothetical protein
MLMLQRVGDDVPTLSSESSTSASTSADEATVATQLTEPVAALESPSTSTTMGARTTPTTTESSKDNDDPGGTPLARFNNLVNYERYGDDDEDQGGTVVAAPALLKANLIARENHLVDSEPGRPLPLVVSFLDLMHMAFRSATSNEMQRKRSEFFQQLKRRGGYCVVEMDRDDVEARILHEMWDLMDNVLVPATAAADDPSESSATMLRRQVLKRSTISNSSSDELDNPGYDFLQTTLLEGSLWPLWIEEGHGLEASQQAAKAYMLLAQLCKAFATVVYAGSSGTSPDNATRLMESLLDDPSRPFGGSYHRLCRYLPLQPRQHNDGAPSISGSWGESLRPHVDWTISTAIPVSNVEGLEVYEPSAWQPRTAQQQGSRRWIRIEEVAYDDWQKQNAAHNATNDGATVKCCWNAHYVVVFAGAWLELLTDGDVESTLHRVVSRRDATADTVQASPSAQQQRLSAPFFMRPKELVFEKTDQVFDNPNNDSVAHMDSTEVVRAMGQFLREFEFLQV